MPSVIQSQDPKDDDEYGAGIRQRSNRQRINQFAKHVEILEEQYIDKKMDVPVMLLGKVPTAQTVHQVQWRCIRCSAVYRHSQPHFREQAELSATHRHSTRARSLRCQL